MHTVLHALSTPRRREILRLVVGAELSAGAIHRALGDVTFGAISQHLKRLEDAGLVRVRREGRSRLYAAQQEALGPVRGWLESLWNDALYRLRLRAELEEARRGPRRARARSSRTKRLTRTTRGRRRP